MHKGLIYFLKADSSLFEDKNSIYLKIGKVSPRCTYNNKQENKYLCGNLIYRIKELQTACPVKLTILKVIRVTSDIHRAEKYFHKNYNKIEYLNKLHGEWYFVSNKMLNNLYEDVKQMINKIQNDNSYIIDENEIKNRIDSLKIKAKEERKQIKLAQKFYKEHGYSMYKKIV